MSELRHLCYNLSAFAEMSIFVFSSVSFLIVTVVSVDRLFALSLGLRFRQIITVKRVTAVLILIVVGCAAGSLLKQFWNYKVAYKVMFAMVMLCFITPFYSCAKIFIRLRQHGTQVQGHNHNGPLSEGIPLNIERYRKTVSAAVGVQLALVACYLPYALLLFLPSLFPLSKSAQILSRRYTTTIVFANSSLNPFLYCWKIRGVRQAVKETFKQLLGRRICRHGSRV